MLEIFRPASKGQSGYHFVYLNYRSAGVLGKLDQNGGFRLAAFLFFAFMAAFPSSLAQKVSSPTLDQILLQLESNLHRYDSQVPNFFCNEHVVSSTSYDRQRQSTITDSVFRLERNAKPNGVSTLVESREVKTVNGSSAEGKQIAGPSILTGVFSGGLDTVSQSQRTCMRYTLEPVKQGSSDEPYVVQFATLPGSHYSSACVLQEEGFGRVVIDPASMQVLRMELTAPHHIIFPSETGVWEISVDYAPVRFGNQSFWMPTKISSKAVPSEAYAPTAYSFDASYTEYHKLEVSSRIVPLREDAAPK